MDFTDKKVLQTHMNGLICGFLLGLFTLFLPNILLNSSIGYRFIESSEDLRTLSVTFAVLMWLVCIVPARVCWKGIRKLRNSGYSVWPFIVEALIVGIVLFGITAGIILMLVKPNTTPRVYDNKDVPHNECYVCGDPATHTYYGRHYCPTHYAMVKTVAEAD